MSLEFIPEKISLEIRIKKSRINKNKPSFLAQFMGFQDEQNAFLKFFGLENTESSVNSSRLFLRNTEFNGLLLSTQYMDYLFRNKSLNFDKMVMDNYIVKEIPVLYSKVEIVGYKTNEIHEYEQYLRNHFDNVYVLNTKRELIGDNPIIADTKDKTKRIYSVGKHPINQWVGQMSKTNRIKLKLIN